ncbi:hypothetical protein IU436_27335 [Nocardia farcinica]|uniref:hypothetical protein n=1 Tax=Nocardia farcinica TaxID=37329 RepID=UPI001894654A|nr:hypothetical protein [Nocardia farcinica]MBF6422354.1 hypothetical protein [Nocardia farcinica]MBF6434055.1 hypothetical protein [Nocardia farcinica]MBF6505111.1 hypothetical protein [Nocardia farcinica]
MSAPTHRPTAAGRTGAFGRCRSSGEGVRGGVLLGRRGAVTKRAMGRWARVLAVLALVLLSSFGPGSPTASAFPDIDLPDVFSGGKSGFSCKEAPQPELPKAALPSVFDASSAERPEPQNANPTGYQTYGWAGLSWHTYDLGCGEDLVRAPGAVLDTRYGNTFLTVGKSITAAAFWLDDQTKTGKAAEQAGVSSALAQFDRIVTSVSKGMFGVYSTWIGVGLAVAASIMAWHALKSDTAKVTKTAGVAMAAMALGALMVGAPQKAIQVADDTLGSLITETQDEIFSVSIDDGGGTLGQGVHDPRNVLLDRILYEDIKKGWFGANYTEDIARCTSVAPTPEGGQKKCFWLDLRDSLAFTYAEQKEIEHDPGAGDRIAAAKAEKFQKEVIEPLSKNNLSYYTFQGKDSGRAGIGFLAMLKVSMPSILWLGGSLLKLLALLSIRFAILFAPIWIPIAAAHGGLLSRVMRTLASAYMWGVFGSVIVALYLVALVRLYVIDNGSVDGTWRLWFMVLLTVVCWYIMRPFKRVTQTIRGNQTSLLNRKGIGAQQAMKRAFMRRAGGALGGPAGAAAGDAAGRALSRGGVGEDAPSTGGGAAATVAASRPEGRDLNHRRQVEATQARSQARKDLYERTQAAASAQAAEERDARIAGIAAAAGHEALRTRLDKPSNDHGRDGDNEASRAVEYGVAAVQRMREEPAAADSPAELVKSSRVKERWDGGDGSAIAPLKVYTPARGSATLPGIVPMVAISAPKSTAAQGARSGSRPQPKVWDPARPSPRDGGQGRLR